MLSEIDGSATPFEWVNVGDRLSEIPAMAEEVLHVVLALAVHMIGRFGEDDSTVLAGAGTVAVGILNADLRDMGVLGDDDAFGNGEASLAGSHLNAMVGDAKANRKS